MRELQIVTNAFTKISYYLLKLEVQNLYGH